MQRLLALARHAGLSDVEQGTSYGTPSLRRRGWNVPGKCGRKRKRAG